MRIAKKIWQAILCFIYRIVFDGWIGEEEKVVRVKGWRTAIVETKSKGRKTITPLFFWFD